MRTLKKLTIHGFKSVREQTLDLEPLNVFIGGNGVGKSNLIGVFQFLREIINQRLGNYTAIRGGCDSILHFGRKKTPEMFLELEFGKGSTTNSYEVRLAANANSGLSIIHERSTYHEKTKFDRPYKNPISSGSLESMLQNDGHISARQILKDLESYRVYHFHDTSDAAAMKGYCDLSDNRVLHEKASNLAGFLYFIEQKHPNHFALITDTVKQVAPFFGSFQLAPGRLNEEKIRLEWKEQGHDGYFNATSLSDGTLRFICLATLLLQPELPAVVLLDEPELGLHPAAITLLADLLTQASERSQVLVATQSVTLINRLVPEQVWTVNREENQSAFKKLGQEDYTDWLDDYALGDLWEKNLINARP